MYDTGAQAVSVPEGPESGLKWRPKEESNLVACRLCPGSPDPEAGGERDSERTHFESTVTGW